MSAGVVSMCVGRVEICSPLQISPESGDVVHHCELCGKAASIFHFSPHGAFTSNPFDPDFRTFQFDTNQNYSCETSPVQKAGSWSNEKRWSQPGSN